MFTQAAGDFFISVDIAVRNLGKRYRNLYLMYVKILFFWVTLSLGVAFLVQSNTRMITYGYMWSLECHLCEEGVLLHIHFD